MAASRSDPYAVLGLGHAYYGGTGTARNLKRAASCYAKAARARVPGATLYVAKCRYYLARTKAARRSLVPTLRRLGRADPYVFELLGMEFDYGTPRRPAAACRWYRKAAEAGQVDSMVNFGYALEHGDGVRKDIRAAMAWYARAAAAGHPLAKENLRKLKARCGRLDRPRRR